ncbi:MAG: N-acetyl-gamma-glutamyl-phosphate reductase [Anaerolineae bacterium]|nr:N-acetyl-gamma-glutamyl-phosphate reductase [Anaerolineae bacterium]
MIKVGIYGATGYTGIELARLLWRHPEAQVAFATSQSNAGGTLAGVYPTAPPLPLTSPDEADPGSVDAVFLCLPHTAAAPVAAAAVSAGARAIDLSADLRLDSPEVYRQWYGVAHPAPHLLPAPYGLPEINRINIAGARWVANPGCYATAVLLAVYPLIKAKALMPSAPIIADAKSGVSGAGRTPKLTTHFAEVAGNFSPYNIGRAHRHVAEIEQELNRNGGAPGPLIFSPHLLPVDRGILATVYAQLDPDNAPAGAYHTLYQEMYRDEPRVHVLPAGQLATLSHAVRTYDCVLSLTPVDEFTLIIVSVIDNLLKGAASQAVQNFNLMFGLSESCGLE